MILPGAGDDIFNKKIIIKKKSWRAVAKTIHKTLENPVNKADQILLTQNYIKSNQGGTLQACNEILKIWLDRLLHNTNFWA